MVKQILIFFLLSMIFNIQAHASEIYKNKLVGGWTGEMGGIFNTTIGLHEDGKYFMKNAMFLGIELIEIGNWSIENNQLILNKKQMVEVAKNEVRTKDELFTLKLTIVEIMPDKIVLESINGLDETMRTEYTRVNEIYTYSPPSTEEIKKKKIEQIKNSCLAFYSQNLFETANIFCQAASRHNVPQAYLLLAAMYYYGDGVKVDKSMAKVWFDKAIAANLPEANSSMEKTFSERPLPSIDHLSKQEAALVGAWCFEGSSLEQDGDIFPSIMKLLINEKGDFLLHSGIPLTGKYQLKDNVLSLGESGDYKILQITEKKLLLKNTAGFFHYKKGNCSDTIKKLIRSLLLDNAIVLGLNSVIDVIIESGHDINTPNSSSGTSPTPLISAAKVGNVELVKRLIKLGADVKISDFTNQTALDHALKDKNQELVNELVSGKK
jgi:hypothetical protein